MKKIKWQDGWQNTEWANTNNERVRLEDTSYSQVNSGGESVKSLGCSGSTQMGLAQVTRVILED